MAVITLKHVSVNYVASGSNSVGSVACDVIAVATVGRTASIRQANCTVIITRTPVVGDFLDEARAEIAWSAKLTPKINRSCNCCLRAGPSANTVEAVVSASFSPRPKSAYDVIILLVTRWVGHALTFRVTNLAFRTVVLTVAVAWLAFRRQATLLAEDADDVTAVVMGCYTSSAAGSWRATRRSAAWGAAHGCSRTLGLTRVARRIRGAQLPAI